MNVDGLRAGVWHDVVDSGRVLELRLAGLLRDVDPAGNPPPAGELSAARCCGWV